MDMSSFLRHVLPAISICGAAIGSIIYFRNRNKKKPDKNKSKILPLSDDSQSDSSNDSDIFDENDNLVKSLTNNRLPNIKYNKNYLEQIFFKNKQVNLPPQCVIRYDYKKGTWEAACSKILKYGFPGNENLYFRDKYIISYSFKTKQPNWVMERIEKKRFHDYDVNNHRGTCQFIKDNEIPELFSSSDLDYKNSGYDRGHLAAFANHFTQFEDNCSTFYFSNISPQIGIGFNRNIWEQLESHVRDLRKNNYKKVFVCTGPLYIPDSPNENKMVINTLGSKRIPVPTHFFKAILGITKNKRFDIECFVIPNRIIPENIPLESFHITLNELESLSGLLFFDKIPREELIEVQNKIKVTRR